MSNIGPLSVMVLLFYSYRCLTGAKCSRSKCENGGTCIETRTSEQCHCREGFSGDNCTDRQVIIDLSYY